MTTTPAPPKKTTLERVCDELDAGETPRGHNALIGRAAHALLAHARGGIGDVQIQETTQVWESGTARRWVQFIVRDDEGYRSQYRFPTLSEGLRRLAEVFGPASARQRGGQ